MEINFLNQHFVGEPIMFLSFYSYLPFSRIENFIMILFFLKKAIKVTRYAVSEIGR